MQGVVLDPPAPLFLRKPGTPHHHPTAAATTTTTTPSSASHNAGALIEAPLRRPHPPSAGSLTVRRKRLEAPGWMHQQHRLARTGGRGLSAHQLQSPPPPPAPPATWARVASASEIQQYDAWPSKAMPGPLSASPQLLRDMVMMIDNELSLLDMPPGSPTEAPPRVQGLWQREHHGPPNVAEARVFLSALCVFVNASRLYAPVLQAIYKRLEAVLDSYEAVARVADDAERKFADIQSQCEAQINDIQERHSRDSTMWAERLHDAEQLLRNREEEVEDTRKKRADLQRLEQVYTDKWVEEREKVLVMVNQIRDAEEQHQETMVQYEKLKRDTKGVQELMSLYQKTADELQQMKEDFAEHVPARQCAMLQRLVKDKSESLVQMRMKLATVARRIDHLEKEKQQQQHTIEELEEDCRRLREGKGRDTPRPGWVEILQESEVGVSYTDQSSQELAVTLCQLCAKERERAIQQEKEVSKCKERLGFLGEGEISETPEEVDTEYFVGLGTGKDVPKYLRWFGQVVNRDLPKREVEHFIADFWGARRKEVDRHEKVVAEEIRKTKTPSKLEPVEEYMNTYLKAKYGMQSRIVDKGYNIRHACKKYSYDADCELFLLILEGHLPEAVHFEQVKMLDRLQRKIEDAELPGPTGKRTGRVKKGKVLALLDKFFNTKSDKGLVRLKYALSKQFAGDEVVVPTLFAEDREGNQGPFLEAVRDQMVKESVEYYQQISNAIFLKAEEAAQEAPPSPGGGVGEPTECIAIGGIKEAILEVDPQKPGKEVDRMLCLGLGVPEQTALNMGRVTDLQPFLWNLKQTFIARHTKIAE